MSQCYITGTMTILFICFMYLGKYTPRQECLGARVSDKLSSILNMQRKVLSLGSIFGFIFLCEWDYILLNLKCCIMLHMHLELKFIFYFNSALYVWLLMTFKKEKVKWPKEQPHVVSWNIIQENSKEKSKFITYYTNEYTTTYVIRSNRRKVYAINILPITFF